MNYRSIALVQSVAHTKVKPVKPVPWAIPLSPLVQRSVTQSYSPIVLYCSMRFGAQFYKQWMFFNNSIPLIYKQIQSYICGKMYIKRRRLCRNENLYTKVLSYTMYYMVTRETLCSQRLTNSFRGHYTSMLIIVQSIIDISNSDISNSVELEASVCIKHSFDCFLQT